MRPFFIVIMTGPRELSANTTDLYSGSPLRREQVCVYVCELDLVVWEHRLLLHMCFGVHAITHPSALESSAAQLFLLTGITITVNVASSMIAPFNSTPPKNLTNTHRACCSAGQRRVPEAWTHCQAV